MPDISINQHQVNDIDLFVFDKDGTLINLYHYWYKMIELRAQRVCANFDLCLTEHQENLMSVMGIDFINNRLNPEGPVGLRPRTEVQEFVEGYLEKLGLKETADKCFLSFQEADELSLPILDQMVKPFDGVIGLLKEIKSAGGSLAIATSDKTERARLALKLLNIEELFDLIVGFDQVSRHKPEPEILELITKRLGIKPVNSVMIGDSKNDIEMGINAEFKASIAVCSGLTDREDFESITKHIINDVTEIKV